MRRLGRGKGDDGVGGKDRAGSGGGGFIGGPAGGQIDSENRRRALAQPCERGQCHAFHRRLESRAQHGIDDQVGGERVVVLFELLGRRSHMHRAAHGAGQLAPGHGRVAAEFIRRAQQDCGYVETGFAQQPRRHHAVAAVVAGSAKHGDAMRLRELPARECGDGRGGRAHQVKRRNAEALRGGAVASLHFGCGKNVHRLHGNAVDSGSWLVVSD